MNGKSSVVLFLLILVMVLGSGCGSDENKPLWQQLDEAQYDRYKPRLDYMTEKYGEEFTMDGYGTVFSVEHPDWNFNVRYLEKREGFADNYIVFLRREEIREQVKNLLASVYPDGQFLVVPSWFAPDNSTKDTTAEELLSLSFSGGDDYVTIICYTAASGENRDAAFTKAIWTIQEAGYAFTFIVRYTSADILGSVTDEQESKIPIDESLYYYSARSDIWGSDPWQYEWREGLLSERE